MQKKMLLHLDAKNAIAFRCAKYNFIAMNQMNCVQYHKGYLIWFGLIHFNLIRFNIDEEQKLQVDIGL